MSIGGKFPLERRLQSIRDQFLPGQIFYLFCDFTIPSAKDKYVVLACVNPRPLVLLINTKKSELVRTDPELESTQVLLTPSDYPFLRHDSYINCLSSHDMRQDEIEQQVLLDMSRIKGRLNRQCISEL